MAAAQSCVLPPPGMVGWWPGDGDAIDIKVGNNGTLQGGAAFAPGKVAQAFGFASAGAVTIPYSAIATPAEITVDAWVNPTSIVGGASIFNWRPVGNATGLTLEQDPIADGGVAWNVFGVGGATSALSGTSHLSLNSWTHVAATYDGATATVYFNGVAVGSTTTAYGPLTAIAADASIGRNIVSNNAFNGLIDEVEVFDRALSATEIMALVNAGPAGKCKDILFRNGFGDTHGLTVSRIGAGALGSLPAGIDCGATCAADFPDNSVVTVTPVADANAAFMGWGGACSGIGTCSIAMTADQSVSATFMTVHTNCIGPACSGWNLGQTFFDFVLVGTYNQAQATQAANAWPVAGSVSPGTCGGAGANLVVFKQTVSSCATWNYSGSHLGHVHYNATSSCICPLDTDPTWN